MTVLTFEGLIEDDMCGDGDHGIGCVKIAGRFPLHEAEEAFDGRHVTVAFASADHSVWVTAEGELYADTGMRGYSEWTPGEVADLRVGSHGFHTELAEAYYSSDASVRLVISDEPVNLLEAFPPTP